MDAERSFRNSNGGGPASRPPFSSVLLTIITGPLNSGKTTYLSSLVAARKEADEPVAGIVTEAVLEDGVKAAYRIRDLATGETRLLATRRRDGSRVDGCGFDFSSEGFDFARDRVCANIRMPWICLDEVGPLEMRGRGYTPLLYRLFSQYRGELVLVVRDYLLEDFIRYWNLKEFQTIRIPQAAGQG